MFTTGVGRGCWLVSYDDSDWCRDQRWKSMTFPPFAVAVAGNVVSAI